MTRTLFASVAAVLLLTAAPSFAQEKCPPATGKDFSGKCMSPQQSNLEDSMQQTEKIASQSDVSKSAPPVPPALDPLVKQQNANENYEFLHTWDPHHP